MSEDQISGKPFREAIAELERVATDRLARTVRQARADCEEGRSMSGDDRGLDGLSQADIERALEHEQTKQPDFLTGHTIGEQARQAVAEMIGAVRDGAPDLEPVTLPGALSPADAVFLGHLDAVLAEIRATLLRKRHDYGTDNLTRFAEFGVLVRTFDKLSRLDNLLQSETMPANEPIADTWLDVAGYGILGLILHQHGVKGITGRE